jgi:large-conductance mechanosensitive channel
MTLGMKQSILTRNGSGTQDGVAICVSKFLSSHQEILVHCINYLIYAFFVLCVVSLLQEESETDNDQSEGEEGGENHEKRIANNNNRPSHARKPKEGNSICISPLLLRCTL